MQVGREELGRSGNICWNVCSRLDAQCFPSVRRELGQEEWLRIAPAQAADLGDDEAPDRCHIICFSHTLQTMHKKTHERPGEDLKSEGLGA